MTGQVAIERAGTAPQEGTGAGSALGAAVTIIGNLLRNIPPQLFILLGMVTFQVGTATAKDLFERVPPAGVSFARFAVAALVLLAFYRPKVRAIAPVELRLIAGMGASMAAMNGLYFLAVSRLPLGIATAVAFSGPFLLALVGSKQRRHVPWVVLAAAGVVLLAPWGSGVDVIGFLCAAVAGVCFTFYMLAAKRTTSRVPSGQALALAMLTAAVLLAPIGIWRGGGELLNTGIVPQLLAVALLSTIIPYSLDFVALKRMSASLYAVLISLDPAVSALTGLILLAERISTLGIVAIGCICLGAVGASWSRRGE